jgi:hypothetical protein
MLYVSNVYNLSFKYFPVIDSFILQLVGVPTK